MAPGRKKGANKAKGKSELSLGDLVLAKVKGFPFWPAKISRPEDWKHTPDPKKYFVHFFGTEEIAFVGPADIQVFTDEVKSKLILRCQGKSKHFTQAVKEICAAFEELQKEKASGLGDDTDRSAVGSDAPSVDGMDDDGIEVELNDSKGILGPNGETSDAGRGISSVLEYGFHKEGEMKSEAIKSSLSCDVGNNLSPVLEKPSSVKNEASNAACEDSNRAKSVMNGERILVNGHNSKMADTGSKRNVVDGNGEPKNNREHVKYKERVASGKNRRDFSPDALKPDPESRGVKEEKAFLKSRKESNVLDDPPETVGSPSELFNKKKRNKPGLGKTIETLHPSKKSKHFDDETNKGSVTKLAMSVSPSSDVDNDEAGEPPMTCGRRDIILALKAKTTKAKSNISQMGKVKSSTSSQMSKVKSDIPGGKGKVKSAVSAEADTFRSDGFQTGKIKSDDSNQASTAKSGIPAQVEKVKSDVPSDEAVLPLSKRRRRALEAMSDSGTLPVNKMESSPVELKDNSNSNTPRVLAAQPPKRRRAVCLVEGDDEDEEPRTPVHGGSGRSSKEISSHRNDVRNAPLAKERKGSDQRGKGDSCKSESNILKNPAQLHKDSLSPGHQRSVKRLDAQSHHPRSPAKSDAEQLLSSEDKPALESSKSSHLNSVSRPAVEQQKTTKPLVKASTVNNQKRSQVGSVKILDFSNNTHGHASSQKSKPASVVERPKSTPKVIPRMSDSTVLNGTPTYVEFGRIEDKGTSLVGVDSVSSMKHLIAAAQAKRREAHSQHFAIGYPNAHFMSLNDAQGMSSSPSLAQPFPSATKSPTQADVQCDNSQASLVSPSAPGHQSASDNQVDGEENEERVVSSGQRGTGGSLSGGTEAAVSRDAFEGMIETLSRTKESIGRATRLAIDCAKYGIANEVVELLIRKLESESSFHRKVDLFFLVDSITQCSHNHKGIAGASYVPTVQAALPRLLGAAAPSGASGRENRRQCLKVLRLWLERKILPESLLRRHIDEIGGSNDDTSSGFSSRRPSRAERAVDDPIREMEGMFVDEYGSNATFQLPGFLSSNVFEDDDEEEDIPSISGKEGVDVSPLAERTNDAGELETSMATPSDRRHCILEDVDGELEMEDVSGHQKEDRPLFMNSSFETDAQQQCSDGTLDSASGNSSELPPLPEGSPPLPPGSPPAPPPLPASPPPPPPPPPPASPSPPPPPPPPPPTLSQPPLPPPPVQPPPPPPPPPPPMPPLGPPSLLTQPSIPAQPSLLPPPVLQSHSSIQSSPQLAYQKAGNQIIQMSGNSLPQQSTCFAPTAICNPGESSGFNSSKQSEYGHNEIYVNPQASQLNPHFQPPNAPFVQRPLPPNVLQSSSGHFSFAKPTMLQHPQHMYPGSYSLPSHPDGQRRFVADEHWRPPTNEYSIDNQHNAWMSGRNQSHPVPSFNQEGYFRPPLERPPPNNMGFQHAGSSLPGGSPIPGHSVPQMLPSRPDMPTLNCWRPA